MVTFQQLNLGSQRRLSLQPLTLSKDSNPTTHKVGIRSHALPMAILLKLLSILRLVSGIISIPTASGRVYLNKGSFEKWCHLHHITDTALSPLEKIHHIHKLAVDQLNRIPDQKNQDLAPTSQTPLPNHLSAIPSAITGGYDHPLTASADLTAQGSPTATTAVLTTQDLPVTTVVITAQVSLTAKTTDLAIQALPAAEAAKIMNQGLQVATPSGLIAQPLPAGNAADLKWDYQAQAASALPQIPSKRLPSGHTAQIQPEQTLNQQTTKAAPLLSRTNIASVSTSEQIPEPAFGLHAKPSTPSILDEATVQLMLDQFDQLVASECSSGLNIEPVWSQSSHENALKRGTVQFEAAIDYQNRPSMYIAVMRSFAQRSGVGTACMRQVIEASFKEGLQGRVHCSAAWSSHVFHHYMGMEPIDQQIPYVSGCYGSIAQDALMVRAIILQKLQSASPPLALGDDDSIYCDLLLDILKQETGNKELIFSEQLLIDYEPLFKALELKTASYLQKEYFESLLDILERDGEKKLPDTSSLSSVNMHLSDAAIARWKEAIDNKKTFIPFKDFEHLRPLMTAEQQNRLGAIVEKRKAYKKRQPFLKFVAVRDFMNDSQRALLDERLRN